MLALNMKAVKLYGSKPHRPPALRLGVRPWAAVDRSLNRSTGVRLGWHGPSMGGGRIQDTGQRPQNDPLTLESHSWTEDSAGEEERKLELDCLLELSSSQKRRAAKGPTFTHSGDNTNKWKPPNGDFLHNLP